MSNEEMQDAKVFIYCQYNSKIGIAQMKAKEFCENKSYKIKFIKMDLVICEKG